MKKMIMILAALLCMAPAFAQSSPIPQRLELVEVDINEGETVLEIFNSPVEGQNHYYLSVGHLGIGDEVVQLRFDPLFELFLPLGDTLAEAMERLQTLQNLYKEAVGTSIVIDGNLAAGFPNDKLEPVTVTLRKPLLTRMLEFSVEREGYIRSTHVSRMDFGSIVTSMKLHRKIHPND